MRSNAGFTLVEILVALAILAIALTTALKATSQTIRDMMYLQNKMTATWVGNEIINETRAGILVLPLAPAHLNKETEMLNQKWFWEANLVATPNPHIKQINVKVSLKPQEKQLAQLESYLYVAQP